MDKKGEQKHFVAERVKAWGKPQPDDCDFSWARGASTQLLEAGCIYEYARESRKLRSLLVLMLEARKRRDFERCSFEGFREEDAVESLSGAFGFLYGLSDQLADNKSFAELIRTRRVQLERSLAKHPIHPPLKAIRLAFSEPWEPEPPWPWQPWSIDMIGRLMGKSPSLPERHISKYGSEKIAIEIRWGDFNAEEIAAEMKRFGKRWRPPNQNCKEPKRRGVRPQSTALSHLKALSVMRIWERELNRWKRLRLVAKVCGYKSCRDESAAYPKRCREGRGDEPINRSAKTEMSKARKHALEHFQRLFPGEKPSNYQQKTRPKS